MLKNLGVTRLTYSCGITALLSIGAPADAQMTSHYSIVLGSYNYRNIAFRELRELESEKNLHIHVLSRKNRQYYRIVDGPYRSWRHANDNLKDWNDMGVKDAWINENNRPSELAQTHAPRI